MKTKHQITIAISLFVYSSALLQACSSSGGGACSCKQVSCPAYKNVNFDLWFPYTQSQQIVFADSANLINQDTIVISTISATQSYEASQGCGSSNSGCSSDKYIYSPSLSFSYNSSSDWDGNVLDSSYSFSVYNFSTTATGLSNVGLGSTTMPSQFYPAIDIGGQTYANVQVIFSADTTNVKDSVYQVYLQKGTGLLAFRYYPSKTLFVKK